MRSFFLSLPRELEESAMIDGCSRYGAFFKIIVPISLPGLLSTLIFSMILAWEELLFALVLTNRHASTHSRGDRRIAGDTVNGANWGRPEPPSVPSRSCRSLSLRFWSRSG